MNLPKATTSPRSRRRAPGSNAGSAPAASDDPRVNVLIELPWIGQPQPLTVSSDTARAESPTAASIVSTVALPPHAELPDLTAEAYVAVAAPPARSGIRIDAAHPAAAAPHSASPRWTSTSQPATVSYASTATHGMVKRMARRPAVWLGGIVGALVLALVLFRNDQGDDTGTASADEGETAASAKLDAPLSADKSGDSKSAKQKRPLPHRVATKSDRTTGSGADVAQRYAHQANLPRHAPNTPAVLQPQSGEPTEIGPMLGDPQEPTAPTPTSGEHEELLFEMVDEPPTMPTSPHGITSAKPSPQRSVYSRTANFSGGIRHQ